MTTLDLARLEALERDATPGPWDHGGDLFWERTHHAVGDPDAPDTRVGSAGPADAALIAEMRNALRALLAAARREEAMRAELANVYAMPTCKHADSDEICDGCQPWTTIYKQQAEALVRLRKLAGLGGAR